MGKFIFVLHICPTSYLEAGSGEKQSGSCSAARQVLRNGILCSSSKKGSWQTTNLKFINDSKCIPKAVEVQTWVLSKWEYWGCGPVMRCQSSPAMFLPGELAAKQHTAWSRLVLPSSGQSSGEGRTSWVCSSLIQNCKFQGAVVGDRQGSARRWLLGCKSKTGFCCSLERGVLAGLTYNRHCSLKELKAMSCLRRAGSFYTCSLCLS